MPESGDASEQHKALFLLSSDNPIRKKARGIVQWPPFEYIILLVIIVNCIIIGIGFFLEEEDDLAKSLEKTELVFLVIFVLEMLLKTLAYGFVLHPGSYLRDPWNILDFCIIIIGFISMFPTGVDLNVLRLLRALRLLRLLRLIKLIRKKN